MIKKKYKDMIFSQKVLLYKRRYDLVKQRLLRDSDYGESSQSSIYSFLEFVFGKLTT